MEKSEIRGIDAAGFWGVGDGKILYHKEPGKASWFVRRNPWKKVARYNPNLLLVHARAASKGVGEPQCNKNNHPFTTPNKSVGLVHNGRIEDYEYESLKQKYEVISECDSEILLRIFDGTDKTKLEDFEGINNPHRIAGIKDIFSYINDGHMAVAIGEVGENDERRLWLFRNKFRPLWVVDMRETLGQVFFVSEPKIWEDAVRDCSLGRVISRTQKMSELPTEEIWYFQTDKQHPTPDEVYRFEVSKDKDGIPWEFDGNRICISKDKSDNIVTSLSDSDEPKEEELEDYNIWELNKKAAEIQELVSNINTTAENLARESSIKPKNFQDIVDGLEYVSTLLEETYSIIEK